MPMTDLAAVVPSCASMRRAAAAAEGVYGFLPLALKESDVTPWRLGGSLEMINRGL